MSDPSPPPPPSPKPSLGRRAVIAIITDRDRWLVIRRSAAVVAPGKLCLPGGKVDPGETEIQTLVREMAEEIGVAVTPGRRVWQSKTPWGTQLAWWTATIAAGETIRPDPAEVAEVMWLTAGEILDLESQCLPSLPEFVRINQSRSDAMR